MELTELGALFLKKEAISCLGAGSVLSPRLQAAQEQGSPWF